MPSINLTVSGDEDQALAKSLAKTITYLTQSVLNKKPEVTAIMVSFVPKHLWFIESKSLEELQMNSFNLLVKVTDSTNLKADKAKYIREIHDALSQQLGSIHPVSYTAIQEMKADAYGYDGLTIEYKYIHNQAKAK